MTYKLGIICGGPSLERGISLNSARSLLDHLSGQDIDITVFYVDTAIQFYQLDAAQLYSNTPSDFDFKLAQSVNPLVESKLISLLQSQDLVFPVIHGPYGEDGRLQEFLEQNAVNFVGTSSANCALMFDKFQANNKLSDNGYHTLPSCLLSEREDLLSSIKAFWEENHLERAIIKPVAGGSSIGVASVSSIDCAYKHALSVLTQGQYDALVMEPFCTGIEFTVCVLQAPEGKPVALIPSEIDTSYEDHEIFSYRRKYLPTGQVQYYCPPRFSSETIDSIRAQAEELFKLFNMRDFVRIDGWLLEDGSLWFSDINPISGMEQNSFIFQQASRVGLTHQDLLNYILINASKRSGVAYEPKVKDYRASKTPINVLMGGGSSERQVSLMSGTNVWLKLLSSDKYRPQACLLDLDDQSIWVLPYDYTLSHTVEEILFACNHADLFTGKSEKWVAGIRDEFGISEFYSPDLPERYCLNDFLAQAKEQDAFIFLALHGGMGEDGTLQQVLDDLHLRYNGSGPTGSRLGMDKYLTAQAINRAGIQKVRALSKIRIDLKFWLGMNTAVLTEHWGRVLSDLNASQVIIKPISQGCSSGVVVLDSAKELRRYLEAVALGKKRFRVSGSSQVIDLSSSLDTQYMLEPFIQTDTLRLDGSAIFHEKLTSWIELTVVVESFSQKYHALNPSITVAKDAVLSLEEKFQGGTGVNLTPPPSFIMSRAQVSHVKRSIAAIAKVLKLENYARIDLFFNCSTEEVIVIEANTLPALTPSTVLFQQMLAEPSSVEPLDFLEQVIKSAQLKPMASQVLA